MKTVKCLSLAADSSRLVKYGFPAVIESNKVPTVKKMTEIYLGFCGQFVTGKMTCQRFYNVAAQTITYVINEDLKLVYTVYK